ncbi:heparinase II/III domain-containing protein [Paucibacter sp. B51]|uniref:heparinase II/III domain-containing protein n=1 Tax=Paucibacter sp. B51 TaxID=2993315 RepID=UPI0022EC0004|nr:heparinase II/III family protein [Paucibacter sp. B51]
MMATPTPTLTRLFAVMPLALLAACQQPRTPPPGPDLLNGEPPAAGVQQTSGGSCAPLPADWLELMPAHQRRILPEDCTSAASASLFSWAEVRDRVATTPWSFTLRIKGGAVIHSRNDLTEPRLLLQQALPAGDYEWSVAYNSTRGSLISTQWRRFTIEAPLQVRAKSSLAAAVPVNPLAIPNGASLAYSVLSKTRPRLLPAGSSYAAIATAAQGPDYLPVLNALRTTARFAMTQPVPAAPPMPLTASDLAKILNDRAIRHTARNEREYIETLAIIGRLDKNLAMLALAKQRLLALAAWAPRGASSETSNDQANREIHLALATGLDLFWSELSATERSNITAVLRDRILQAAAALSNLDREPYDSHGIGNVRWINQSLLLAAGLPGFPEAQTMLAKYWELSRFTLGVWGDRDGGFGNGIAYGWYAFVSAVPFVATVRTVTGVDLYQLDHLRRAGQQLMAFTAPNRKQPSAFGDETETEELYAYYASNYYRMHAQMTRDPVDAWYWQVNPNNVNKPNQPLVLQLLLLGSNSSPLPAPQAPSQHHWFSQDAGLAALHVNAAQSARTSLFFRSSRFGAFSHSHADQNSVVYVSQGQPLLINAGYYPYFNSPHHKNVTRATRYKNALTFDGGFGQSESVLNASKPSVPAQSMDTGGKLLQTEVRGNLTLVSGDATAAYRAINTSTGQWAPLLSNAVRSVVMDRSTGITLIYDWATSSTPRRWELNYHSPNSFKADAATVQASNGSASVCLDRYGPATSFAQTMAWEIAPEVSMQAQAHGRFTMLSPSTELAHLTVLRDSCRIQPLQVQQNGTRIQVVAGSQTISFDKRLVQLPP